MHIMHKTFKNCKIKSFSEVVFYKFIATGRGEGSSARNSSARKIYSTPKSRLLDTKSGTRTA